MTLYLLMGALLPLLAGLLLPLAPGASLRPGAGAVDFPTTLRRSAPWILLAAVVFSLGQVALNGGLQWWPSDVKHWLVHLALLGALMTWLPAKLGAHLAMVLVAGMIPLLAQPYILHTWEGGLRWQAPLGAILGVLVWEFLFSREPSRGLDGEPAHLAVIRGLLPSALSATALALLVALSGSVKVGQQAGVLAALTGGLFLGSLLFRRNAILAGRWMFLLLYLPLVWVAVLYARLPLWTALALVLAPLMRALFPATRRLASELLLQLPGILLLAAALVEAVIRFRAAAMAPPY
jgi:hypothetical protein